MAKKTKNVIKWLLGIILVLACIVFLAYAFLIGPFVPGNASKYSVEQTQQLQKSPITGKTIYFLGSSITLGLAAQDESMVDFIEKRNNCTCVKNAKSGTTLLDNGKDSYVQRMYNFDTNAKIDAFVCQLSTNDANVDNLDKLGKISNSTNRNDFNKNTTIGAIEYIISYAKETWNCPVIFYTNTYFENNKYELILKTLYDIKDKSDIEIIDLYNDKKLNDISTEDRKLFMLSDNIHPHKAGYKLWWTPVIEKKLYETIGD